LPTSEHLTTYLPLKRRENPPRQHDGQQNSTSCHTH